MNNQVETRPVIAMDEVGSSQISHIGHDPETNTLAIRFTSKDDRPGSVYHYQNFTAELFQKFKDAESIGSYFYKHIKPCTEQYPYTKIS